MTRKDILRLATKAEKACQIAANACADVDAAVATYWKSDRSLWHISKDVRSMAETTYGASLTLSMALADDTEGGPKS